MHRYLVALAICCFCLLLVSCDDDEDREGSSSFPMTITRSDGALVTLDEAPTRIVSLSAGATETLYAIGAKELLVAVDDVVDYPTEAADFPAKLAWEDVNASAVAAFEPDLVIVSFESSRHVGLVSEMEQLGLKVWCCDAEEETLDGALEWMLLLGQMVDRQREAENLVAELSKRISDVEQAVAEIDEAEQLSVFWEVCLTCAPGHNTLPNDILRTLKLKNVTGNFAGGAGFVEADLHTIVPPETQVFIVGDADLGVTVEDVADRA